MATNYPGPWQMRFFYTTEPSGLSLLSHVFQLNLDISGTPSPGDLFATIDAKQRDTTLLDCQTLAHQIRDLVKVMQHSAHFDFLRAELWKYDAGTFEATYYSTLGMPQPGTGVTDNIPSHYHTYSFRTQEGGVMYVTLHDQINLGSSQIPYADLATNQQAFVDH